MDRRRREEHVLQLGVARAHTSVRRARRSAQEERARERKGLGPFVALRSSHLQPVTAQRSLTYASILTIGFIKVENSSNGPPAAKLPTLPSAYLSPIRIDPTGR